jgi:hypothetical protein
MVRAWRRDQRRYHADSEREYRVLAGALREQIGLLRRAGGDDRVVREATDRLFESLRLSAAAGNSREVEAWRRRSASPERTAVALKWAEAAADEARYFADLHAIWRRDLEGGGIGHWVTDDEVPPFRMPAGWTPADLLYR